MLECYLPCGFARASAGPCTRSVKLISSSVDRGIWGFPKIRGTILGVPIIRTIVYWGLYWGPLFLGNYHLGFGALRAALAYESVAFFGLYGKPKGQTVRLL